MGFSKSLLLLILLYLGFVASGQDTTLHQIREQFMAYQQNTLQEKVYVHTDKSTYLAGELLWFKIYDVDALQNKLLQVSKVAYVDILDRNNTFLLQVKVPLENGTGTGSAFLPLNTTSGNYKLRAYTNWMKNFGAEQFFEKPITVVNTLKNLEASKGDTSSAYAVRFFPEGGNLVNGLESRVGVQVIAPDGVGAAFHGTIVTENGDSVAAVQSFKFGIGRFQFTPLRSHTYNAIIRLPSGQTIKKELPRTFDQGYVMQLQQAADGRLSITASVSKGISDRAVYLLVHTNKEIQLALAKSFVNGKAVFNIDTAAIANGITCFTLFNEARQPVCERLFFKKPTLQPLIQLTSDQAQYGTRKKVELTLHTTAVTDTAVPTELSMAVFKIDTLQPSDRNTIYTYLWLTSQLSRKVEAPEYYFSNAADVAEATDNLMLTHGWRRFRWEPVLNTQTRHFAFPPELDGQLLSVLVSDIHTKQPVPGVNTYLSIPGTPFQFYASQSDSTGVALFNVKNQFGAGELIFQANTEFDSAYTITLLPSAAQSFTTDEVPAFTFSKAHREALLEQSIGMQVQHIYRRDSLAQFQPAPVYDTVPFYGKPDYSYALDAYTRFPTIEEVLREYVRPINVVQRRGGQHLLIMDEARLQQFDGGELVLLDGIPLFNKDAIFAYDPLKVKKLDVITHKYFIGPVLFNGVASFTTYTGRYEGLQLDPRSVVIDYEGLQREREFYEPVYETPQQFESRMPDFRSTLLWEPHLSIAGGTSTISLYTSDVKGTYFIEVEGLDQAGHPVVARLPIDVK